MQPKGRNELESLIAAPHPELAVGLLLTFEIDQELPNFTALMFQSRSVPLTDFLVSLEFLLSLRFLARPFVGETKPIVCFRKQRVQLQSSLISVYGLLEVALLGM
jgi:hypothetical protein